MALDDTNHDHGGGGGGGGDGRHDLESMKAVSNAAQQIGDQMIEHFDTCPCCTTMMLCGRFIGTLLYRSDTAIDSDEAKEMLDAIMTHGKLFAAVLHAKDGEMDGPTVITHQIKRGDIN